MAKPEARAPGESANLGDFTATARIIPISLLAIGIGALSAYVALALLKLIGLFTNLFFFQRIGFSLVSPADHRLGVFAFFVPVVGCLLIGLLARYGSERIRGHGIPEALEAILIRGSRIQPRVALLKPVSAAISIGSGGPFGAEGPIIMTGGAFGSIIAQLFHLTSAERKTLLVAGAAGGMSATFASPVAAVLLAVELLLFEWKPRSFIPVALSSAMAAAVRHFILGPGPLFPTPPHPAFVGTLGLLGCVIAGLAAGGLSALMTKSVYAAERFFERLKMHWMWWPVLGGVVIGLGGLVCPGALGVGYDRIEALLNDSMPMRAILLLVAVKWTIWAVSLGSGTSGGVLAPLLMMGAALGGLEAQVLPAEGAGFWPLVSMGAILAGTMRSPLTGLFFTLELTHDFNVALPVLIAGSLAYGFTVLTMQRSILTEKVAKRGFHVTREYSIDPLEVLRVEEVMRTREAALAVDATARDVTELLEGHPEARSQQLYPVIDGAGAFVGVVTRRKLDRWVGAPGEPLSSIVRRGAITAFADETLRSAVHRMAKTGLTRLPVVARGAETRLLGTVSLEEVLKVRARHLEEEQRRERVLPLQLLVPSRRS